MMDINMGDSIVGTMFKSMITMQPMDGMHLADLDFTVEVYALGAPKSKTYAKSELSYYDDDSYMVVVDSAELGTGEYWATLTLSIPDNDCKDGIRREDYEIPLGVTIKRRRR